MPVDSITIWAAEYRFVQVNKKLITNSHVRDVSHIQTHVRDNLTWLALK